MKYMGSKRSMLKNGLGELLLRQAENANRVVDLLTGAGFVAWFVAENVYTPVLAVDLQRYSTILAEAIIGRIEILNAEKIYKNWVQKAVQNRDRSPLWNEANRISVGSMGVESYVNRARRMCEKISEIGPIWSAYGGHYFSPSQALTFDYLLDNLPENHNEKIVSQAACIFAASECVASPGHTAQPFQPTSGAGKYILEAWERDPIERCKKALEYLCPKHALVTGEVITDDGQSVISQLNNKDLVFIDPPYSSVQYSRFYHVLEVIARGRKQQVVEGVGRYPPLIERPQSRFSNISQSKEALKKLLEDLAEKECTIIFTFPSGKSSNGLSGDYIKELASQWFTVDDKNTIIGKFSTLGGNNDIRDARQKSSELILLLKPKSTQSRNRPFRKPASLRIPASQTHI